MQKRNTATEQRIEHTKISYVCVCACAYQMRRVVAVWMLCTPCVYFVLRFSHYKLKFRWRSECIRKCMRSMFVCVRALNESVQSVRWQIHECIHIGVCTASIGWPLPVQCNIYCECIEKRLMKAHTQSVGHLCSMQDFVRRMHLHCILTCHYTRREQRQRATTSARSDTRCVQW